MGPLSPFPINNEGFRKKLLWHPPTANDGGSAASASASYKCTRLSSRGATPPSSTTTRGRRWAAGCRGRLGSSTSRDERERAGASHGRLHAGGSTTTTRRLGRLGRAAPSRTGRAPYPARRKSHSDEKRGSTDGGPIHQLHSSSGVKPRAAAVRQALPPRPPGPLRVLELCLSTASAMAAPLWGVA